MSVNQWINNSSPGEETQAWKKAHFTDMKVDQLDTVPYQPSLDVIVKETILKDKLKKLAITDIVNNAPNLYNSDGTLVNDRVVNCNNDRLDLTNVGGFACEPYVAGDNKQHILCEADFIGSGNPGVGLAVDGGVASPNQLTHFVSIGDFGGGKVSTLGYSDQGASNLNNAVSASATFVSMSSNDVGGNEAITLNINQVNPYAGNGQTNILSNAIVLNNTPVTDNANTEILSRNSVSGALEVVDKATIGGGGGQYARQINNGLIDICGGYQASGPQNVNVLSSGKALYHTCRFPADTIYSGMTVLCSNPDGAVDATVRVALYEKVGTNYVLLAETNPGTVPNSTFAPIQVNLLFPAPVVATAELGIMATCIEMNSTLSAWVPITGDNGSGIEANLSFGIDLSGLPFSTIRYRSAVVDPVSGNYATNGFNTPITDVQINSYATQDSSTGAQGVFAFANV